MRGMMRLAIMGVPGAQRGGAAAQTLLERELATQPNTLVAYWPLSDAIGATAIEDAKNSHDGVPTDLETGIAWGVGDGLHCATFNGSSSFVNFHSAALASAFNGASGTLSVWFSGDDAIWADGKTHFLARIRYDSNNQVTIYKHASGNFYINYAAGGIVLLQSLGANLRDWHKATVTWDKAEDTVSYYLDTTLVATKTDLGTWSGVPSIFTLGVESANNYWYGLAAHYSLRNVALTKQELDRLYIAPIEDLSPAIRLDTRWPNSLYQDIAKTTPAAADTDPVAVWVDRANGAEYVQDEALRQPARNTDAEHGHPVVAFNAAAQTTLWSGENPALATDRLVEIIVYRVTDLAADGVISNIRTIYPPSQNIIIRADDAKEHRVYTRTSTDSNVASQVYANLEQVMITARRTGAQVEMRMNGNQAAPVTTTSDSTIETHLETTLGAQYEAGTTLPANAQISGLLALPGALTDEQVMRAEEYMAQRYGIRIADLSLVSSRELYSAEADPNWFGRPRLLDRGDGVWILVYRIANEHGLATNNSFNIHFSDDEGRSWSERNKYLDGTPIVGFPMVGHAGNALHDIEILRAPNGDLLCLGSDLGVYQHRSTDDGLTWVDEGLVNASTALKANSQPIVVGSTIYYALWESGNHTELWASSDSGESWGYVSDISSDEDGTDEAALIHLGDDNLTCLMRVTTPNGTTLRSDSADMGVTWSAPAVESAIYQMQRPYLRRYPGETRIYLIGRGYSSRTVVWYSDDDLAHWHGPFLLDHSAGDGGYCDMLPRSDGTLYLVSYGGPGSSATKAAIWEYVIRKGRV